ncbi:MAG: phosphate/phosphite/phosphonate ABC transporter substrate-binding protein [Planctomycetes bacterium]|nr:phosphate/phosphite/phosphonate ABC transporter substrate-binding protein [Planctomycetota bacterium]
MKRYIAIPFIVLVGAFLLFSGCGKSKEDSTVVLNMVFVPASEKGDENDFATLLKIVEDRTGYKIKSNKVTDYNAAVEAMRAGRADMAWYGAKTYIQAADIAGAEAFAVGVPKGKKTASYHTHFIVKKGSPITAFTKAQIQGTKLALNHVGSTSGDLIPRYELLQINLDTKNADDFEIVQYAGSHDAAIMSVLYQTADVGGVSSVNWDARILDKTINPEDFTIIHSSPPIMGAPLAYSKTLPSEIRQRVKKAVLEAHNYGTIGGYGGEMDHYEGVVDSDYDITRAIAKTVK